MSKAPPKKATTGKEKGKGVTRFYKAEDDAPSQIRQGGVTYTLSSFSNGQAKYSPAKPTKKAK